MYQAIQKPSTTALPETSVTGQQLLLLLKDEEIREKAWGTLEDNVELSSLSDHDDLVSQVISQQPNFVLVDEYTVELITPLHHKIETSHIPIILITKSPWMIFKY